MNENSWGLEIDGRRSGNGPGAVETRADRGADEEVEARARGFLWCHSRHTVSQVYPGEHGSGGQIFGTPGTGNPMGLAVSFTPSMNRSGGWLDSEDGGIPSSEAEAQSN